MTTTIATANFILTFGKFKGQNFNQTPDWYQNWLVKQDWFKIPTPKSSSNGSSVIKSWGVYYVPTREAYLCAGFRKELEYEFQTQDKAIICCDGLNVTGRLDEMHSGYRVYPIY